jgi:hypothetical protein
LYKVLEYSLPDCFHITHYIAFKTSIQLKYFKHTEETETTCKTKSTPRQLMAKSLRQVSPLTTATGVVDVIKILLALLTDASATNRESRQHCIKSTEIDQRSQHDNLPLEHLKTWAKMSE